MCEKERKKVEGLGFKALCVITITVLNFTGYDFAVVLIPASTPLVDLMEGFFLHMFRSKGCPWMAAQAKGVGLGSSPYDVFAGRIRVLLISPESLYK